MYSLQIQKLIVQKDLLDNPIDKIKLLQQAIQIADAHQDVEWAVELRWELIDQEISTVQRHFSLEALSWIIGIYEQDNALIDENDFLWLYIWVLHITMHDPDISATQRDTIVADFSKRFQRNGYSLQRLHEEYFLLYNYFGIQEKAQHYQNLIRQAPADDMARCTGCSQNMQVEYCLNFGDVEKAKVEAHEILNRKLVCDDCDLPDRTLARMSTALTKQNKLAEAKPFFDQGMQELARKNFPEDAFEWAIEFAYYLSKTNNAQAWEFIETHYPKYEPHRFLRYQMAIMMLGILKNTPSEKIKVQFPDWVPFFQNTAVYDKAALETAYYQEAKAIGQKMATREGLPAIAAHSDQQIAAF